MPTLPIVGKDYRPIILSAKNNGSNVYGNLYKVVFIGAKNVVVRNMTDSDFLKDHESLVTFDKFSEWKAEEDILAERNEKQKTRQKYGQYFQMPEQIGADTYKLSNGVVISFSSDGHVSYKYESPYEGNTAMNPIPFFYLQWIADTAAAVMKSNESRRARLHDYYRSAAHSYHNPYGIRPRAVDITAPSGPWAHLIRDFLGGD